MGRETDGLRRKEGMHPLLWSSLLAILVWTLLIGSSLFWNISENRRQTAEMAQNEARALFNKDKAFRIWGASHGGVYVPKSDRTPSNPFLSHVPERDIRTASGKELTLMNPAYMLRQMMEEYEKIYGVRGHITSKKHFRPETAPDPWEIRALDAFEKGQSEVFEFTTINGRPFIRLMQPLFAQKSCLKCHAFQGYKEGDLRGGVSVAVPMEPYVRAEADAQRSLYISHLIFWLLGLAAILFISNRIGSYLKELERSERALLEKSEQLESLNRTLEERVATEIEKRQKREESLLQLSRVASMGEMVGSISHHWRQPLNIVGLAVQDLLDAYNFGELDEAYLRHSVNEIMEIVGRMSSTINTFWSIITGPGVHGVLDLCASVKEILEIFSPEFESHFIVISLHREAERIPITADRGLLGQALRAILRNSIDAFIDRDRADRRISVTVRPLAGGGGAVEIADNAGGIPPEIMDRIFDPFFTTRNMALRTGTGLYFSKVYVEQQMGGRLTAKNVEGGAHFTIELPLKEPERPSNLSGPDRRDGILDAEKGRKPWDA